ncbi:hypothetical protein KNP414_06944 [Paenibacillus mucilaginosus KNP414]|uniref:Uncharacterized protein n=1 Tax=Paenibacillus mucilaginosus (strain KNP414) TaxID=1036673 RepID=F8FIK2_PAEMK|nr:hypothetical protein KNP414_06944 [Paenibacillus mucilaginosus KNP414]
MRRVCCADGTAVLLRRYGGYAALPGRPCCCDGTAGMLRPVWWMKGMVWSAWD